MALHSETKVTSFGDVPKSVQDGNELAILELLIGVTTEAKVNAPVDKGQLRNSIMYRTNKKEGGFNTGGNERAPQKLTERVKVGQGVVGSNLLHAIYNEFGTRKMMAQPFLRPAIAVKANGAKAKESIKKFQEQSVREGMAKGPRKTKVNK